MNYYNSIWLLLYDLRIWIQFIYYVDEALRKLSHPRSPKTGIQKYIHRHHKKARISWGSVDSFQWFEFNPCMYQFKLTANCNNDFSHCHTWSNPTLYGTHKSLFFLQNHYLSLRRKTRVIRNQPHKKSWYVFIYRNNSTVFDSNQLLSNS